MEAAATTEAPVDQNGHDPTGDVPLDGEEPGQDEVHDQIVIEGDGQMTLAIGGKNPTVSKVVLRGGQIPIHGSLKKGDRVTLQVECRVAGVHIDDVIDSKTRDVVETRRKHVLKPEGVEIIDT